MYKYRINHFLSRLPITISIEKFRANLMAKHNIGPEVFYADRFIKLREYAVIPAERLEIYAQEFNIPLEELFAQQESASR
jgi:hypothetical protein